MSGVRFPWMFVLPSLPSLSGCLPPQELLLSVSNATGSEYAVIEAPDGELYVEEQPEGAWSVEIERGSTVTLVRPDALPTLSTMVEVGERARGLSFPGRGATPPAEETRGIELSWSPRADAAQYVVTVHCWPRPGGAQWSSEPVEVVAAPESPIARAEVEAPVGCDELTVFLVARASSGGPLATMRGAAALDAWSDAAELEGEWRDVLRYRRRLADLPRGTTSAYVVVRNDPSWGTTYFETSARVDVTAPSTVDVELRIADDTLRETIYLHGPSEGWLAVSRQFHPRYGVTPPLPDWLPWVEGTAIDEVAREVTWMARGGAAFERVILNLDADRSGVPEWSINAPASAVTSTTLALPALRPQEQAMLPGFADGAVVVTLYAESGVYEQQSVGWTLQGE